MGLTEKRAVKDFQDKMFPNFKKEIDEAAGFNVQVEVNWDSLAVENESHLFNEAFPKVYFTPLIQALKKICADDMGRDALKNAFKKVKICNLSDTYGESAISYSDGVLTIDHRPTVNLDDIAEREGAIVSKIESSL